MTKFTPDIDTNRQRRPQRLERPERPERPERLEWPENLKEPERTERPERPEKPERLKLPENLKRQKKPEGLEKPQVSTKNHGNKPIHNNGLKLKSGQNQRGEVSNPKVSHKYSKNDIIFKFSNYQ